MSDLAILYEHPAWFGPLFDVLTARGIDYSAIPADGFFHDPGGDVPPAPVVFNRVAMSSFLRSPEHPIFHASAALSYWRERGARVINGADVLAIDASKARQLSLIGRRVAGLQRADGQARVGDDGAAVLDTDVPIADLCDRGAREVPDALLA